MNLEFEVSITAKDLYRFNMRNAYTSFQGILSIICAALVVFVFIWKFDKLSVPYIILFIVLALAFLLYIPISLWIRSKQIMKSSDVLREPLTYIFEDEGVKVDSPATDEESAFLPYADIFKVAKTKSYILIYSNRVSAYIIPRGFVQEAEVIKALKDKVEDYKLRGFGR